MKWLIACEESGVVRDAFIEAGHDAESCDLLPSDRPGPHIQGDVRELDLSVYDGMIAHPPCDNLAVSGARWFEEKRADGRQQRSLDFVRFLLDAPVERIALENPVSIISTEIRKPDQYVQPWQFGHGEVKKTGFWLKGLPLLTPTDIVSGREPRVHYASPGPNRGRDRARFLPGMARAMAEQWGNAG